MLIIPFHKEADLWIDTLGLQSCRFIQYPFI